MENMIAYVVIGIVFVIFLIMSIVLLSGRGSFLIAGYNTSSKKEKEKYDSRALSKFTGKILLIITLSVPMALGDMFGMPWLTILFVVIVTVVTLFAVIYLHTGNRFKK